MTQIKNPEAEMAEAAEAAPACKLEFDQSQNIKIQGSHPIGYILRIHTSCLFLFLSDGSEKQLRWLRCDFHKPNQRNRIAVCTDVLTSAGTSGSVALL